MAGSDSSLGFARGFSAELDKGVADRKQAATESQQQSDLAYARQRRLVTDTQKDQAFAQDQNISAVQQQQNTTDFNNRQTDREASLAAAKQGQAKQQAFDATEAEKQGVKMLATSLNDNADPRQVEDRFNATAGATGTWKIQTGSLQHDQKTGEVSFIGAGGTPYHGSTKAILDLFSVSPPLKTAKDYISAPAKNRVLDAATGKTVLEPSDTGTDENGDAITPDGRKISAYNPQTHQAAAAAIVDKAYRNTWNPDAKTFTIGSADDSDRATFGGALAEQGVAQLAPSGPDFFGAGEVGEAALRASKLALSHGEAESQATKELTAGVPADQAQAKAKLNQQWIAQRAQQIYQDGRVKASQQFQADMNYLQNAVDERKQAAKEQQAKKPAAGGGKKPLKPAAGKTVNWTDLN